MTITHFRAEERLSSRRQLPDGLPEPHDLHVIADTIKEVLSERIRKPATSIRLEDDLLVDLGLDSLAFAELLTVLEQHLQRQVRADQLLDVATVGDLASLLAASEVTDARECQPGPTRETAGRA